MSAWVRMGGAAGLVFVLLTVLGGIVQGDVPVYSDGPVAIKAWFAENSNRYLAGGLLIILASFFYLGFLAALVTVLNRLEGGQPWSWLALLGGVHLLVAAQASIAFDGTLALLEGDLSDDLARALSAGDYMTFLTLYFFAGILTLSVSVVIFRTRALWIPLAWLGPLITIAGVFSTAAPLEHDAEGTLTYVGYFTLIAFLVWTVVASLAMIRSAEPISTLEAARD